MKLIKLLIILVLLFVSSFSCCYFRGNPINGGSSNKFYSYNDYSFQELNSAVKEIFYSNQNYIVPIESIFLFNNKKESIYEDLLKEYTINDLVNDKKLMIEGFSDWSNLSDHYFFFMDDFILNILVNNSSSVEMLGPFVKNENGYYAIKYLNCGTEGKYTEILEREIITKLDSLLELSYPGR